MSFKRKKTEVSEIRESIETTESNIKGKGPYELIESYEASDLLNSGSTLLNLACSDMIEGGYYLGGLVHMIGVSGIGKSLSALTAFAEAVIDSRFDKYALKYDEAEARMRFPLERMFGKGMKRVEFIPMDAAHRTPRTIQAWAEDRLEWYEGKGSMSCIDITDSMDAVTTDDDMKADKKVGKGGWKTEKAIVGSATFPKIIGGLEKTRSVMIILSQTRANIGGGMFAPQLSVSGGNAFEFYATHRIWLSKAGRIKETIRGKDEEIGTYMTATIKKNSLTGKRRAVKIRVLDQYGIDDIGSMVDWMVDRNFWGSGKKKKKDEDNVTGETGTIITTGGDFIDGKFDTLVKHIEDNGYENDLRKIVGTCWTELETDLLPKRKNKYV